MSYVSKVIKFENNKENTKHILLCGDKNYIKYCGVTLTSILLSNQNESFTFHIFCDDISEQDIAKVKATTEKFNINILIHIFNKEFIEEFLQQLSKTRSGIDKSVSFYQCFRFLAYEALADDNIDYVLYLDSDILVNGNIDEFWVYKNTEYVAVVIADKAEKENNPRVNTQKYFNSGVMFVNLKKWKNGDYTRLSIQKASEKKWYYIDQDSMNILLDNKCLYISENYNYYYNLSRVSDTSDKPSLVQIPKEAKILHFVGISKPWHSWVQDLQVIKKYNEVKAVSPWFDNGIIKPDEMKTNQHKYFHKLARISKKEGNYLQMTEAYFSYGLAKLKYLIKGE